MHQLMSFLRSSPSSSNYNRHFDMPEAETSEHVGGAMLPIFLNNLQRNNDRDHLVEVTLEMDDNSFVLCSVKPSPEHTIKICTREEEENSPNGLLPSSSYADDDQLHFHQNQMTMAQEEMKSKLKLVRNKSSAQRALGGLRFISKTTAESDTNNDLWVKVETRFDALAKDGLLTREDFGECIGMGDSKEFAVGVFDALVRRRRQKMAKISKTELHEFWLQISDQSFHARLHIFFDMADSNGDGRIAKEEVQELIMLSISANNLSKLKESAAEYASLIMEDLDPEGLGYIELETLLLQRDNYVNYSRPLSTTSVDWNPNLGTSKANNIVKKASCALKYLVLENWHRGWILLLWLLAMIGLFTWKFMQYRQMEAFQVMGYCLATAKGAAETLKFNMALILLPVCRNILTRLRSTSARILIPFDDNINFHKIIAHAIAVGIILHAANHLACDFPHLVNSSPEKFALVATDFNKKPSYKRLLTGVEGITGISMLVLMTIAFILATRCFRRSILKLPPPLNRLTGFNAFWYSHHLLVLVYLLLLLHGAFLFFVHKWYQKTTWIYISIPLILYIAERTLRTWRSEDYAVKILKVSVLPGDVLSLIMSKPPGFKYKSGQYIFLQCATISSFEWHPFSMTSAPGDDYLSIYIRIIGDWTEELKRVFTEDQIPAYVVGRAKFEKHENVDQRGLPRLLVDGPYGAPAQDYQNYDVLLLVGLGIGATPFISILKDLLNNTRAHESMDANTETSASDDSWTSFASSSTASSVKKKSLRTRTAYFYWVTREPGSLEWFKGVMNEVAEMDHKGQIEMHNYLTSVYEEGDARSALITMVQALNHAKHGVDILSGTRVRTHFARPKWIDVFKRIALKHPYSTVGVFYCGMPVLAKELKKLSQELTYKTSTRFEFHKEYF